MSRARNAPSGRIYFTSGDYSGEAQFVDPKSGRNVEIPMEDILYLAALMVRSEMEHRAESWSDRRILGLPEEGKQ
jgi:hypothetical protein